MCIWRQVVVDYLEQSDERDHESMESESQVRRRDLGLGTVMAGGILRSSLG